MSLKATEEYVPQGAPHTVIKKKICQEDTADCTPKCRSRKDAAKLIAAVTRGTDQQNLGYLATSCICRNPGKVADDIGRTLLHMAASVGKRSVCEWLIKYRNAPLNSKDSESGYTALHRAVFYGHIHVARFLIESGSNIAIQDHDGLTPLDHIVLDRALFSPAIYEESHRPPITNTPPLTAGGLGEAYVWGTNANFTLGLGHQKQKDHPTLIEQLSKANVYISKVVLQKFHSAILTTEGKVFTFGHGQGGRLGHGNEDSQLHPQLINALKDQVCIGVALGVDHSMFLAANGIVWTCGSNTSYQLGHSGTSQSTNMLSPQPIGGNKMAHHSSNKNSEKQASTAAIGIAANMFHSLFWTKDALYTWGLNAGQLGHLKGEDVYITNPKLVSSIYQKDHEIADVVCSEGAIVVQTTNGELIALYEYQTKKRITPKRIADINKVAVIGGHLDSSRSKSNGFMKTTKLTEKGGTDLKIFVLTKGGKIYIWEDASGGLLQCVFSLSREILMADLAVNKSNILLISKDGHGFEAVHVSRTKRSKSSNSCDSPTIIQTKSPSTIKTPRSNLYKFLDKSECDLIRIKQRLFAIHRGVSITSDPKGKNFCIIQASPNAGLYELPDVM